MNQTKCRLRLFLGIMIFSSFSRAAVWVDENQWSPEWENKYHEWVKTNASANMFANEKKINGEANPYYGIRVDCADLVYSLRILFSYENKLPFAMVNPVRTNGPLISNKISRFDGAKEGLPRLKKFLVWLYDMLSTHSLPLDTYAIPFKKVVPGSIILTSRKNHHSWTVKDISKAGNPTLIFNSTVGRESGFQVQERQSWPNPFWIFEPEVDQQDETKNIPIYFSGSYAGFRYWRPIEFLKHNEKLVPGFSDEQHLVGISEWKTYAQTSLAQVKESIDQVVLRLLKDACSDFTQRVSAVQEAESYKENLAADFAAGKTEADSTYIKEYFADSEKPSDNRCMIYKAFDQFSTPSRDKRFIDSIILARAYFSFGINKFGENAFSAENLAIYKALFPLINLSAGDEALKDTGKTSSNFCSLSLTPELGSLTLTRYKRRVFANRFSSNPNDSYTGRFGYPKTDRDLADTCPAYDLTKKSYNLDEIEQDMIKEVLSSAQAL